MFKKVNACLECNSSGVHETGNIAVGKSVLVVSVPFSTKSSLWHNLIPTHEEGSRSFIHALAIPARTQNVIAEAAVFQSYRSRLGHSSSSMYWGNSIWQWTRPEEGMTVLKPHLPYLHVREKSGSREAWIDDLSCSFGRMFGDFGWNKLNITL